MKRCDLTELHYITLISNLSSIMRLGILSHNQAKRVKHKSVAMAAIQKRRATITVPGGRKLHDYANLYICARNPMLYKRQDQYKKLCVLKISPDVIDLPAVVITDGNASGNYAKFSAAPAGLKNVNRDLTFADDWRDSDEIIYYRKKAAKCAEVLVPDKVKPIYISGAYVECREALAAFHSQNTGISVVIDSHLFFG